MKIAISADEHTELIDALLDELKKRGHETVYFGPPTRKIADWPDVTREAAKLVASGEYDEGIVLCWTGTGATIAANKVKGIRASLCHDPETAKGARLWNHANVLAMSIRITSIPIMKEILDAWFSTEFSGDQWNMDQIKKIEEMEEEFR